MLLRLRSLIAIAALFVRLSRADDLTIYTDSALASGWENWSWSSTIDFAASDVFEGTSSISVTSDAWAALSFKLSTGNFKDYAGLRFDISGAQPALAIYFDSVTESITSPSIQLSQISQSITPDGFTSLLIDFNNLPGSGGQLGDSIWDRLSFQAQGDGATYHIDNIVLVESIVIEPKFLSAEPLTNDIVAITTVGDVDFSQVAVNLNGQNVAFTTKSYSPVDAPAKSITYLTLASPFAAGSLTITAGDLTFNYTLPAVQYGSIVQSVNYPINPHIYGVNFPPTASYINHLGVTLSRWGGNAVTPYNPFGHFTNAGNDWYFENRASDWGSADEWVGWVSGAGSDTILTVPGLDWVAKDTTSYSYPRTIYPDQQAFDPYNSDAGNGKFSNGSIISPPMNQSAAYTPWNASLAQQWLSSLQNIPTILALDNEIEIAHSTHQDMHPEPVSYDEELERMVTFAKASKAALPNVAVAAPMTCSWWFYWTSAIGWTDTEAHANTDFLPWFLQEMKKASDTAGKRLLDYLDIHYYFQPDTSANDAAAKALRLRMTRSLWDKTYVDESWVGESPQNHQWDPDRVQLVPRFRTLIDIHYPGTKLAISEWSSTNDQDITGGLVTADALGIFGKYKVDAATYWYQPDEMGPVGLAFWLYRGYGVYFGNKSAQVNLATANPDTVGVYAATENNKLSLVIINKDTKPLAYDLSNVPFGSYFLRHFGGSSGVAKWQTTITLKANNYIVVPAYTAIFIKQQ
ncbi:hypothetical protein PC9H_003045 [Pleurotus ostreatus]|uniref:Glycoside hydrolase family 44 catalytic domain-containing protein n=1 Tax=Pleurotus ostreatus TaxID=5322 RepID=A0A8H7A139_PLEOS|nr:uncharacterized protein PC9H_003045 [Pleurotus ostreatus]KAF7436217.1 hypothetical protein PC9H_003045 [Pleurotus ostreatus]KAJ8701867.1 hypothetical protein PTI98_000619 [Pleurotus ostreatus]